MCCIIRMPVVFVYAAAGSPSVEAVEAEDLKSA
jgi:hypothetical protein